jgi:hypothetical protein
VDCAQGELSAKSSDIDVANFFLVSLDSNLDMDGVNSAIGRAVSLRSSSGTVLACGHLTRNSTVGTISVEATFSEAVTGTVMFEQEAGHGMSDTTVTVDLEAGSPTSTGWVVSASCADGTVVSGGDLTADHGDLSIGSHTHEVYTSTTLNVQPSSAAHGGCLVLGNIANASLQAIGDCSGTPIEAEAAFNEDGVTGSISFSQVQLGCPTTIVVSLSGLQGGNAYHVHMFPADSVDGVGGHFDPFGVEVDSYSCDMQDPATCYVGDLSGKHGTLPASASSSHSDYMLPLTGRDSIMFRSIVIHRADGTKWMTSQIMPKGKDVQTLMAMFKQDYGTYAVLANVTLFQVKDDPWSPAAVMFHGQYNQGSSGYTGEWHVHENVGADDNICEDVGDHYNPFGATMGCSPLLPEYCEVGDLAGKHGLLTMPSPFSPPATYFYTDMQLPLTGNFSVKGQAFVLHAEDGGILACQRLFDPADGFPPPIDDHVPNPPQDDDDGSGGLPKGTTIAIVACVLGVVGAAAVAIAYRVYGRKGRSRISTPLP